MKITLSAMKVNAVLSAIALGLGVGCATQPEQPVRTVPPLYSALPKIELPAEPHLLPIPVPPAQKSIPIVIKLPRKATSVSPENATMSLGTTIKAGSSVVISLPSINQRMLDDTARTQDTSILASTGMSGFKTADYFNALEHYAERELTVAGLFVKDRTKFEAKYRDLHDGITTANSPAGSVNTQSVGKLSTFKTDGELKRQELYDLPEIIRAAQDGEVKADYVLQVNDLSVRHYVGEPLQFAARPEVQAALNENPGLRVGGTGTIGDTIPATLAQPWMLAHFNAKLINVKTGTLDWMGDYSIESLAVLDDGMTITIDVRRLTANAKTIVDAIVAFNDHLRDGYQKVQLAKNSLENVYRGVMQPVTYQGYERQGETIQEQRKTKAETAERAYSDQVKIYKANCDALPPESKLEWTYLYVLDQPTVSPDLANPKTEDDGQRLMNHVRALGSKITHDLLGTLKVAK